MALTVLHEKKGSALWITINRPEKRNAIDQTVIDGISEGIALAQASPEIRAIVLTGHGDTIFCAGADLQPGKGFGFDFSQPTVPLANLMRQARQCALPVIARVNGTCLAGGMALLSMCDIAVATQEATFGLPEVKVGVFPMQVVALLQDLVPRRVMHEWCLTGERFDAQAARQAGLLNAITQYADLDAQVERWVKSFAQASPTALRRGKFALKAMEGMAIDQALTYAEAQIAVMTLTEDAREGMAAFNEKRTPAWTGR
jgi:methylglutaconyl-CoA hydratase